ncbi:MAG: hypothetical protein J2P37_23865 [Ktedonobacteraceae bacterium]|nr:hypothetical protein [Ktedonobacteraceae bacterium]MBO0794860.1 hypothetical protein [Ktedonobacteraceae bacterium]
MLCAPIADAGSAAPTTNSHATTIANIKRLVRFAIAENFIFLSFYNYILPWL